MHFFPGVKHRPCCGYDFLVYVTGKRSIVAKLNDTSLLLFQSYKEAENFTVQDMANTLVQEYEIDYSLAEHDAQALLDSWLKAGFIEISVKSA